MNSDIVGLYVLFGNLFLICMFVCIQWRCAVSETKYWRGRAEFYQDKADDFRFKYIELVDEIRNPGPPPDEPKEEPDDPADYWKN